jgi:G:T-mismatch repair DNA endonuclease (very short patch repair protein)
VSSIRFGEVGFRVLALWECELKDADAFVQKLFSHLPRKGRNDGPQIEDE